MSHSVGTEGVGAYQRFDCTSGDSAALAEATEAARLSVEQGECIVLPTDTVYGIGADAFSAEAVQRLLDAKRRGRDMPPPVLIGDPSLIRALATDVPDLAKELIAKHWPGPLTVICKIQPSLRMDLGETDGTIALRVPDHELARDVLRRTGPLAVSSANLSGEPAASTCDEALEQLGDSVAVYLDGGAIQAGSATEPAGAPSTIVDFSRSDDGQILRHGALSIEVLRQTLPDIADLATGEPLPAQPDTDGADAGAQADTGAHVNDVDAADADPDEGAESWSPEPEADDFLTEPPAEDPNQPDLFDDPEEEVDADRAADQFRTGHGSTAIRLSPAADQDPAPDRGPVS